MTIARSLSYALRQAQGDKPRSNKLLGADDRVEVEREAFRRLTSLDHLTCEQIDRNGVLAAVPHIESDLRDRIAKIVAYGPNLNRNIGTQRPEAGKFNFVQPVDPA